MTTTPASTSSLDRVFSALHASPVTRSSNRVVAGVCAGLAERTGVPLGVVRVLTVVLAIFGPGVVLYLVAWSLLPAPDGRVRLEQALRGGDPASIALLVVTALALLPDAFFHREMAWLPLVGVGVVALLVWRSSRGAGCGKTSRHHGGRGSTAEGQHVPQGPPVGDVPQGPPVGDVQPGHRDDEGRPQDAPRA